MAYVAVAKALYDYAAQDPETELSLKEDQLVYIIEKEDDDWWKGKLKDDAGDSEGAIGLVPAAYVEELPPSSNTRALYEYESTSPEELSMAEDQVLYVYSIEEDWLLVRPENDPSSPLGFVPRNYCDKMDESAGVAVADADEAEADLEEHRQEEAEAEERRQLAEQQRLLKLKDKVETWNVSEMEGKKKNKGTLGVGNGAVFFASDTDKMSGVKQYNITELNLVSHPSSKNLELTFASVSTPLIFHCGSSDNAKAILAKLETSKAAAGEALEMTASAAVAGQSDDEGHDAGYGASPAGTPASEPKTVRWAAEETQSSAYASGGAETATVLYEFDAQGDDELTVKENETVTVIDKENDEWWSVRNSSGREGVVPAQYLQLNDGSAQPAEQGYASAQDDEDDRRHHEEEEAAAAAALEAERQRESSKKAEQRRAIEKAARERQKQEEEDRRYAEELEAKEAAKAERRARRQAEEQRSERELESARRREQARSMEPPKISKRPSAQDVHEVARSLPTRGKQAPIKPPENDRPKPTPGRTRVWSDKTGQFKVEAEYLGLNGNKIRLHKINGVIIEVPLDKMAQEDVQMIRRHEQRKARAAQDPDDQPLARSRGEPSRSRSEETKGRTEQFQPIPKEAMEQPKPRKPRFDWFAFFLESGCGIDDCTRYAANFERDRVDEEIMPELDASTLRALGLKEGDVIRVRKAINARFAKKTPEQEAQIKQDEDYARQLQEHENSGSKGPIPQPPPSLFTGANGKLANNTRRGRPEKKSTGPESIDAAALIGVSDQLSNTKISTPSPPAAPSPPPVEKEQPKSLIPGFDDDAWTIKPSATKPASPAPQATQQKAAPPPVANTTESLLAQIQSMRPQSTGVASNNTGGSASADRFAAFASAGQQQPRADSAPLQQNQTGVNGYGLGVQGSNQPMGYLNANGARGPLAPVPANQGLLNPLQPAATGFVPTRVSPNATGMMMQQTGFQPQQTGFQQQQQQQQPMMSQPTGYAQGFQSAYGGQQPQIQPNMTGYPGNYGQQSQQSSFNAIASIGPPQQASNPDKFAPTNIFAAMKKQDFGKPEEQRPQDSNKYDALRPLTTGYNGAPGMQGMMPQQTGMMPQQTGMGMGMGMGMGGNMMMQPTGYGQNGSMMNQMTGFNPQQMGQMPMNQTGMGGQMGYMGQQYPQGYR